ncbi:MAG: MOP flippase family protein [Polaromonas sp.]|nr:MOP flippase family protein [Polaromonas sp.]
MTLKQKTVAGIIWNALGSVARQILQVITMIVMTRYLTPNDFGIYAILMIFVTFMQIFASMGTAQAILHIDEPSDRFLSSVFYLNVGIGSALFILLYSSATAIASFYEDPKLATPIKIIAINFIIASLSIVQKTVLEKALKFKLVVKIETIALTLSSIIGIALAIGGYGVASLLIMTIANTTILTGMLWKISQWRPLLKFSMCDIRQIWSYTANLTGFGVINYFSRNADKFLIGKYIGTSSLGLYTVAYKIMLYPLENISRILVRVLLPAFSIIKADNKRFQNSYLRVISFISFITFPLMVGLIAVAETFVKVAFGDQWNGLVSLLRILAPIGMAQAIATTVGSIYMAKGATALMFKTGLACSMITVAFFIIAIPFGLTAVALSYLASNIITLFINLKYSWTLIDLNISTGLAVTIHPLASSLVMGIGIWALNPIIKGNLPPGNFNSALTLGIQIATGIIFYTLYFIVFARNFVKPLLLSIKNK